MLLFGSPLDIACEREESVRALGLWWVIPVFCVLRVSLWRALQVVSNLGLLLRYIISYIVKCSLAPDFDD